MMPPILLWLAALLGPLSAHANATPWVGDAHAAVRLIAAEAATGSAGRLDAGLAFRLAPGWHIYWRTPGDAGVAPSADWGGSENVGAVAIAWPAPRRLVVSGLQNYVYAGSIVLPVTVTLARPGQAARLHAELDYAACANVCVPYHASLDLPVPAGLAAPSEEAAGIATARASVPLDKQAAGIRVVSAVVAADRQGAALALTLASDQAGFQAPDLFIEGIPHTAPAAPRHEADGQAMRFVVALPGIAAATLVGRPLTFTLVDGSRAAAFAATPVAGAIPRQTGWLAILGVALLGGLVLNAMPCALPVLSLKLLAVAHAGRDRRRVRAGLLATAAGVLLSFAVLAGGLIALRAAGAAVGWGIQFQQPWFLAGMATLTALFAASLWDFLPIGLPGMSALAAVQSRRPLLDAMLGGAFMTLLATPCSAPFVGTAIGFALSRGPGEIAAVFAALGLGMAAPFLLVAAAPALVRLLPRPGPWMLWLRRAMGMLLAGTAAWLLGVLALAVPPLVALFAAFALVCVVVLLAWRTLRGTRQLGVVVVAAAIAAVLVPSLATPIAVSRPSETAGQWQRFDPAAIPGLIAAGKTVFVDVTAAWCLTCKVNALTVLDREPIAPRLHAPGTVTQRADWTRPDPEIAAYLRRFGRFGVPLDVVYGPGRPTGEALPELLTSSSVAKALTSASTPAAAAAAGPPSSSLAAR